MGSVRARPVAHLLEEILSSEQWTREHLAAHLQVTSKTVDRWQKQASTPRPFLEGQIRTLHTSIAEAKARYVTSPQISLDLTQETDLRIALDKVLNSLREIFHRRSRLSGRSDLLDEVSKLLFAHVLRLANERQGIDSLQTSEVDKFASNLIAFVASAFEQYLPRSLALEIKPSEFKLRLKPQENDLAREIVECFEPLSNHPGLISDQGIEAVDLINEVFGKFLADSFIDEKQLGQYLTPTEVVRFMVQLALSSLTSEELCTLKDQNTAETFGYILDPSCGVGSFLAEFVRALHSQTDIEKSHEAAWIQQLITKNLVGIDKSERMIRYALTNIAMFGIPAAQLKLASALSKNRIPDIDALTGKVGLILTNPPFGAEFADADLAAYKIPTSRKSKSKITSECLFMERYIEWLRPGGHLLAIVPDSILTNQGYFAYLRKELSHEIVIHNVISLPQNTFAASGTTTKTSILHIQKKGIPHQAKRRALVSRCLDIGYSISTRNSHRVKRSKGAGDLPRILRMIQDASPDGKDSRWVENIETSPRWDANYFLARSFSSDKCTNNVRVSDVATLSGDRLDPRRRQGTFQYIEISDVNADTVTCTSKIVQCSDAPSRARKVVRSGDVLVSTVRPDRRAIAVVAEHLDGAICTTGFAVLRPHGISSMLLAELLKTDFCTEQLLKHNVGIAYPAIDEKCLPDVVLPADKQVIDEFGPQADEIFAAQEQITASRAKFVSALLKKVSA